MRRGKRQHENDDANRTNRTNNADAGDADKYVVCGRASCRDRFARDFERRDGHAGMVVDPGDN
jgi:hypothetical protein